MEFEESVNWSFSDQAHPFLDIVPTTEYGRVVHDPAMSGKLLGLICMLTLLSSLLTTVSSNTIGPILLIFWDIKFFVFSYHCNESVMFRSLAVKESHCRSLTGQ